MQSSVLFQSRLAIQPTFKSLAIALISHTSSVYHETAAGASVTIVSYLVTEDNQIGQALFAFAKAIFIFPFMWLEMSTVYISVIDGKNLLGITGLL